MYWELNTHKNILQLRITLSHSNFTGAYRVEMRDRDKSPVRFISPLSRRLESLVNKLFMDIQSDGICLILALELDHVLTCRVD